MGVAAIVKGNRIEGTCPNHLVAGSPPPSAGPRKFSAPIKDGVIDSVLIGGQPAAVMGCSGTNDLQGSHDGIIDGPFASPTGRVGRILSGSPTVLIKGKMAATLNSAVTCCVVPGKLASGVTDVLIG